jgi:hypothetical protein
MAAQFTGSGINDLCFVGWMRWGCVQIGRTSLAHGRTLAWNVRFSDCAGFSLSFIDSHSNPAYRNYDGYSHPVTLARIYGLLAAAGSSFG